MKTLKQFIENYCQSKGLKLHDAYGFLGDTVVKKFSVDEKCLKVKECKAHVFFTLKTEHSFLKLKGANIGNEFIIVG